MIRVAIVTVELQQFRRLQVRYERGCEEEKRKDNVSRAHDSGKPFRLDAQAAIFLPSLLWIFGCYSGYFLALTCRSIIFPIFVPLSPALPPFLLSQPPALPPPTPKSAVLPVPDDEGS